MKNFIKENGGFTQIFEKLEGVYFDTSKLERLADAMHGNPLINGYSLLAGYTYLGQFIAHDITHLKGSEVTSHGEPAENVKFKQLVSPTLDLSGIYGNGFFDSRIRVERATGKMSLGYISISKDPLGNDIIENRGDVPRNHLKEALIADRRNDDNLLLSQFHLKLLEVHNAMIDELTSKKPELNSIELFNHVRNDLILYFQEAVLFDYLKEVANDDVWESIILQNKYDIWKIKKHEQLRVPVEFSGAAFRFGHAMIRKAYKLNDRGLNVFIERLLRKTGKFGLDNKDYLTLRDEVDWRRFFNFGVESGKNSANLIAPELLLEINVPGSPNMSGKIGLKNLLRGNELKLASGQEIYEEIKSLKLSKKIEPQKLTPEDINMKDNEGRPYFNPKDIGNFLECTPLWFYILVEAAIENSITNKGLGKMGSLIVTETLKKLISNSFPSIFEGDRPKYEFIERTGRFSNLNVKSPKFITKDKDEFLKISDLLRKVTES